MSETDEWQRLKTYLSTPAYGKEHFEIGPPTLRRQEVHQRADGRASEMGVTEGLVIYQTESLAPIRHLQKSSATGCRSRHSPCVKRSKSSVVHVCATTVPRAQGAGASAFA